jgi:hypothetical protein
MNPHPGPRSVFVMDNCHIHHGEEIQALIEDMHCKLSDTRYLTLLIGFSVQACSPAAIFA